MLTPTTWLTSSCFFLLKPGNGFWLEEMYLFIKASARLISDFLMSLSLFSQRDSQLPAHQNYLKTTLKDILEIINFSAQQLPRNIMLYSLSESQQTFISFMNNLNLQQNGVSWSLYSFSPYYSHYCWETILLAYALFLS